MNPLRITPWTFIAWVIQSVFWIGGVVAEIVWRIW